MLELATPVPEGRWVGKAMAARRKGRGISIPFMISLDNDEGFGNLERELVSMIIGICHRHLYTPRLACRDWRCWY